MTRWRCPPESWNGYSFIIFSTRGSPVMRSISMAFSSASFLLTFWCMRIASMIWSPIFITGFKLVIGSWKIMEILLPRSFLRSSLPMCTMSLPSKRISPSSILPVVPINRPMTERAVTLFPLPDSPTIPRVEPSFNSMSTPSTDLTIPLSMWNQVCMFLISRIFLPEASFVVSTLIVSLIFLHLLNQSASDRVRL